MVNLFLTSPASIYLPDLGSMAVGSGYGNGYSSRTSPNMTTTIKLTVNGKATVLSADDPSMPLLYALRDQLGLHGLHFGCGLAQCGACTVHYYGEALRSCVMPVSAVADANRHSGRSRYTREAPPSSASFHRRTSGSVRLLHQWHDHAGSRFPCNDKTPD